MSGVIESGSTRPRPLSGGFWTLLSWLRGEEHYTSSDSISSVGSDRTAVSFAFLAPAHYQAGAAPLVVPPPGPPTDSYKKRVRERNLRRQYDRDTTLHRKYGLFRGEGVVSFDAHSLPPARRAGAVSERTDRERRAASECNQRRTAHVPGKRRAPSPPRVAPPPETAALSTATNRRHTRKRPAPKPPRQTTEKAKENIIIDGNNKTDMSSASTPNTHQLSSLALDCKPEKYTKKDPNPKDVRVRPEKSFLKPIFENKKRNSSVDTSSIKILPSISELDKQAAEIIESSKAKRLNQISQQSFNIPGTENVWYCIKCSKRYNVSVESCVLCKIKKDVSFTSSFHDSRKNTTIYTQTEDALPPPSTSKNQEMEEKQKLKEMLKEMKDSLPKRTKLDNLASSHKNQEKPTVTSVKTKKENSTLETPTLPIGASIEKTNTPANEPRLTSDKPQIKNIPITFNEITSRTKVNDKNTKVVEVQNIQMPQTNQPRDDRNRLHTPLKISSLLNPIYVPKLNGLRQDLEVKVSSPTEIKTIYEKVEPAVADQIYVKAADAVREILLNTAACSSPKTSSHALASKLIKDRNNKVNLESEQSASGVALKHTSKNTNEPNNIEKINNHSRRRDLVNQLEKSIANGDERAAADAAMKLAQLRLSCSVLSFSSQILQQPQTSSSNVLMDNNKTNVINLNNDAKINPLKGTSKESLVKTEPSNQVKENNKKASKGHDASTSTNNLPIKKSNIISSESSSKSASDNDKNKSLSTEESPSASKNPLNSTTPILDITCEKNVTIEAIRSKNCKKEIVKSESLVQPSTSKETNNSDGNIKTIAVWIEDKEKAHGPIRLQISRNGAMGDLRRQAEQSLGLPLRLQRWIVGKELCNNDDTPLVSLAGPNLDTPFYLCVVECDKNVQDHIRDLCEVKNEIVIGNQKNNIEENSSEVYKELVNLERQAAVPNAEAFECEICMEHCAAGDGVVLRECVHSFCRQCLSDVIRHCEEPAVSCPAMGCPGLLHEREIRALVSPEDYERWLNRGLATAESGTRNAFHCRTRDCTGWALCDAGARRFPCPVCKHVNCVPCQAIHEGETCDQYRKKLEEAAAKTTHQTDEGTQALIQSLISRGEALQCPECSAVITKKWGCDWVKCSACKTEICWVTRGHRWGPAGRGDTSAGCKCGVDGKRCHPSCGYCH